jgi:hypothetical protein
MHDRLRRVKERMTDLVATYRRCIPRSRLGIAAWGTKGEPPRALYWIFLVRRQRFFESRTLELLEESRPRWYHRKKVKRPKDLDALILRACLGAVRANVVRFGADVEKINRAHRTLARGLQAVKHILSGRAASGSLPVPLPPEDLLAGTPGALREVLTLAWNLECRRQQGIGDMKILRRLQAHELGCGRFRLHYEESSHIPFGTLMWRDDETESLLPSLERPVLRHLGAPRSLQRLIAPFERNRRDLMRRAERLQDVFCRADLKAWDSTAAADEDLAGLRIDPYTEPAAVTEDRWAGRSFEPSGDEGLDDP